MEKFKNKKVGKIKNSFEKAVIYILTAVFLTVGLVQSIPQVSGDTTTGFILASAGKDGQFNTGDDITATASRAAVKGDLVSISLIEAVPSSNKAVQSVQHKPLRQPNADEIPIYTAEELAKIGKDPKYPLNGKYILMADIDLSGYSSGEGWVPIGSNTAPFTGQFDGNGFVIKNLTINRPSANYQGLFGYTGSAAELVNVTLENVNVTGSRDTGSLVGQNYQGRITNSYSTGSVRGNYYTGGLVGCTFYGTITSSYFTGSVTGVVHYTGGLVGYNYRAAIMNSYSTGSVTGGSDETGGLVGLNDEGIISNCFSIASVTGKRYDTGGLVGRNYGSIANSYSVGSVKGSEYNGGLVGYNGGNSKIQNSYSTCSVTGGSYTGGLVGYRSSGTVAYSYWDVQASGIATSAAGMGRTTAQMKQQATFINWDFTNTWAIDEGKSYPYLRTNEQIPHPGTN
ncbi:GLUG motif-containing protein [Thermoanaerobacter mathranii]|uniref:GLUG motif-containing protein n=1 Tax=Thermoanaerobacter mathranii TaxID=583357 RepID=UPI003D6A8839